MTITADDINEIEGCVFHTPQPKRTEFGQFGLDPFLVAAPLAMAAFLVTDTVAQLRWSRPCRSTFLGVDGPVSSGFAGTQECLSGCHPHLDGGFLEELRMQVTSDHNTPPRRPRHPPRRLLVGFSSSQEAVIGEDGLHQMAIAQACQRA